ncbi:leucine rich repeat-containing protein [Besnoitia besnoiti]|uniref:Leucine rich repeat-containing protein n=1 Tax=Besnoitia besnoiti TaxID=94643 RepID=A0A2A9M708_BESBE|nr:leucine rich repeat-containing protein [Besnoitia besnoiti]PFH31423.1 leucine rich repeat-containing protein [Besnoitia besnoiti]
MAKTRKGKKKHDSATTDHAVLTGDVLNSSLSDVARTVDGSGYAFVRLNCAGKSITKIPEEIAAYVHLRYIDISDNHIEDIVPLTTLPHVLALNAARNNITDVSYLADTTCLPSCVVLNLSFNSIYELHSIGLPRLAKLTLDGNPLASLESVDKLPKSLTHLSLKDTHLRTISQFPPLPKLVYLSVSNCPIDSITDVSMLAALEILDISGIRLGNLGLLETLVTLPMLRELTILPVDHEMPDDNFRQEILVVLRKLQRLNGIDVTAEEKRRAKALKVQRKKERQEAVKHERLQEETNGEAAYNPEDGSISGTAPVQDIFVEDA